MRLGERGQQPIEIRQRLAHPHHHDVAQPLFGAKQPLQPQHLLDDLAGREIAIDAVESAGAEHAAHAAADLRADADRAADFVAEEHALDLPAVGQLQQQLLGAVVGLGVLGDLAGPQPPLAASCSRSDLRQIAHLVPVVGPALEQPLANLRRRETSAALAPRTTRRTARPSEFSKCGVSQII